MRLRKLSFVILATTILAGVSPFAIYASDPQDVKGGEVLLFDDFNNSDGFPDKSVWKLCSYSNTAWGRYFSNTQGYENVKVEDGCLVLTADKRDGKYTTGGIRTYNGFPVGTILEVKARLKPFKGAFPAIWQMPVEGKTWPWSGEVDVMEWVQGTPQSVYQTVHTHYIEKTTGDTGITHTTDDFDVSEDHIYAAARTLEAVIFYIDGVETSRYENKHLDGEDGAQQFPFILWDYDIILNYSFGGEFNGGKTWAGPIDDDELPGEMWIDWVKVSKID